MTTQHDLAEAFRRLSTGLAWVEETPDGLERARGIRVRLLEHLTHLADGLAEKTTKCPHHDRQLAHNCGPCRSERIGIDPDAVYNPATLPPTPEPVRAQEARRWPEGDQL